MTEKSLDCVISILKGEEIESVPDWYEILGFLECNRISGLFYNRAKQQGVMLPKKIENILKGIFERQKRKVAFLRRNIKNISEKLIEAGAEHVLLKGSVLTNLDGLIYIDGERTSNDIDILVKPSGISAVSNGLCELGFIQGYIENRKIIPYSRLEILKRRMNRGEVAPFVKLTGNNEFPYLEVDINFSLGNTPSERQELLSGIIDSSKILQNKVKMRVADAERFFLHLIMHQYKESCIAFMVERNKDLDLYKLADIYYLIKSGAIDLKRLKALVAKYGVEQETGAVLSQVGNIFSDLEIMSMASEYKFKKPQVIDYESKKVYEWTASERERLCCFDAKKYLKEI